MRVIAIWSLIPSYLVGGGVIGYGLDMAFHTFPYLTSAGLLLALMLAVRDMMRLRDEF
jgi:F0F1-type ATP synthase assembly protein I